MKADRVQFLTGELLDLRVVEFDVTFTVRQVCDMVAIADRLNECGAKMSLVKITGEESTYKLLEA